MQRPVEAHPPDKGENVYDNITIYEYIKDTHPRVLRGGTFFYIPAYVPSAIRRPVAPSYRDIFIGFRPFQDFPLIHLDCLASEVRLNVDLDVALTVIAHGCYPWLATRLPGYEKVKPKQAYQRSWGLEAS